MEVILKNAFNVLGYSFDWNAWFNQRNYDAIKTVISTHPWLGYLIALLSLFIISRIHSRIRDRVITINSSSNGSTFIKRSALKDKIKQICRTTIAYSKVNIKISRCFGKLNLRVILACPNNSQLIIDQVQQNVTELLRNEIQITNLGKIDIMVERFFGPVSKQRSEKIPTQHISSTQSAPTTTSICTAPAPTTIDSQCSCEISSAANNNISENCSTSDDIKCCEHNCSSGETCEECNENDMSSENNTSEQRKY